MPWARIRNWALLFLLGLLAAMVAVGMARERRSDATARDAYEAMDLPARRDLCWAFRSAMAPTLFNDVPADGVQLALGLRKADEGYEEKLGFHAAAWILYCSDGPIYWEMLAKKYRQPFRGTPSEQVERFIRIITRTN